MPDFNSFLLRRLERALFARKTSPRSYAAVTVQILSTLFLITPVIIVISSAQNGMELFLSVNIKSKIKYNTKLVGMVVPDEFLIKIFI